MTTPRAKIAERLAAHGRPQMWANEGEAAELSGLSAERFREKLAELESRGFPPVNPLNGKRPIPAILAFWKLVADDAAAAPAPAQEELENWNDGILIPSAPRANGSLPESDPLYAPGIKWRPRQGGDVAYWLPRPKDIKAGYVPKSLTLEGYATQEDIAARCRELWAKLLEWRKEKTSGAPTRFTIDWLITRYETDELSPYRALPPKTQKSYEHNLRIISRTVGKRRIDGRFAGGAWDLPIGGADFRRWHYNWGKPVAAVDEKGAELVGHDGNPVMIPSTPSRARHTIVMLRILMSYAVELAVPGAERLREILSAIDFPTIGGRDRAPTVDEVTAIVTTALDGAKMVKALGDQAYAGGALSIAIATLAQYELTERRIAIMGDWETKTSWKPGWVWENVSRDWTIRYWQTKTERKIGAKTLREFSLPTVQRLLQLMQRIPEDLRHGPIIVCEGTGRPWTSRHFSAAFRKIARAAGVSDDVWSMDMRAGGATEADGIAEITPRLLQDGLGHAALETQERYRRSKARNAQKVVELRQAARRPTS